MTSKYLKELHEMLAQQRKEVTESPLAAKKLLEELGILHLFDKKNNKKISSGTSR